MKEKKEKAVKTKVEILCEVSARHVHLSAEHLEILFGKGAQLTEVKPLSQPGQYLAEQRVDLVTDKTTFKNVAVLGPTRAKTQVELSRTDCFALGLKTVPVRQSGDLAGTPGVKLRNGDKEVAIEEGVIVGMRHVHLDDKFAATHDIKDNQIVSIKIQGERGGTLKNAVARVHPSFAPAIHIDTDEANAMGFTTGTAIIKAKS